MRGLVIGRFQPFHEGHRYLIGELTEEVDEVVVGIGSEGRSHTKKNPFTSGERVRMVQDVLDTVDATTYLIPISDVERNAVWVKHIETICPSFGVVFTNNHLVERLFTEDGYEVRGTPLHNRESYHGAAIREAIIEGDSWRDRVPEEVSAVIDEIDGVERLRKITNEDVPDEA